MRRSAVDEKPFKRPYRRGRLTLLGASSPDVDPALVRALTQTATEVAGTIRACHPGFKFCMPKTDDPGLLADACAHYLVLHGCERQKLLEMLDTGPRVSACLEALVAQQTLLGACRTIH